MRRAIVLFVSLQCCQPGHCFVPSSPFVTPLPSSVPFHRTAVRSTSSRSPVDRDTALDALEKLLERQKAEVRETERIIQGLTSLPQNETVSHLSETPGSAEVLRVSSIGESILSGVDYGFASRSEGCKSTIVGESGTPARQFENYGPPANIFSLGIQQFNRNLDAIKGEYRDEIDLEITPKQRALQEKLEQLTLNSTAIWERERARGPIVAPFVIKVPYYILCYILDVVFEGRYPIARFFLLETVARMPYFSYITMLHFYETVGFWRRSADIKRIHFAEEWNEFHHLMIMESLGGDQSWWVRFLAQHSAVVYYVVLCFLWALSPSLSYKFSEMLETHAVDTYGQFLDENEDLLKELPPSYAAIDYYSIGASDPLFGEYQTASVGNAVSEVRMPGEQMRTLHDVFSAIREDEGDHVGTMKACLNPQVAFASPSLEKKILVGVALAATVGYLVSTGVVADIDQIEEMVDSSANGFVEGAVDDATATAIDTLLGAMFAGASSMSSGLRKAIVEILESLRLL